MTDDPLHDPANMRDPTCCRGQARVTATTLNVRAEPDAGAPIIGKLAAGETVDVWAVGDGWWLIQTDRHSGWCAAEWLAPVKPLLASVE